MSWSTRRQMEELSQTVRQADRKREALRRWRRPQSRQTVMNEVEKRQKHSESWVVTLHRIWAVWKTGHTLGSDCVCFKPAKPRRCTQLRSGRANVGQTKRDAFWGNSWSDAGGVTGNLTGNGVYFICRASSTGTWLERGQEDTGCLTHKLITLRLREKVQLLRYTNIWPQYSMKQTKVWFCFIKNDDGCAGCDICKIIISSITGNTCNTLKHGGYLLI